MVGAMNRRNFLLACASAAAAYSVRAGEPGFAPLPVGQIGTAHPHASGKMLALRGQPARWAVVGLVDPHGAAAGRGEAYRALPVMTEEELLAIPGLRAVTEETAIADSCATALRVIRAGKHVHLDKPGSFSHAEFRAMRSEAERRGLTVQMGYMLRYNPAFELMFQAVKEGWLGEILEIDACMGKLGGPKDRDYLKALPGGGMFELGCHVIDCIVWLLGAPKSVEAFSTPTKDDGVSVS